MPRATQNRALPVLADRPTSPQDRPSPTAACSSTHVPCMCCVVTHRHARTDGASVIHGGLSVRSPSTHVTCKVSCCPHHTLTPHVSPAPLVIGTTHTKPTHQPLSLTPHLISHWPPGRAKGRKREGERRGRGEDKRGEGRRSSPTPEFHRAARQ